VDQVTGIASEKTNNFLKPLPVELVLLIIDLLDSDGLKAIALVNSYFNDIANSRIWQSYHMFVPNPERDVAQINEDVRTRLHAMARIPSRARYIRHLVIGPCHWSWSIEMVQWCNGAMDFGINSKT
jgi:hypothetical protein